MDKPPLEGQLNALFNTTLMGVAAVGGRRYLRVNEEFARIMGLPRAQLEGRLADRFDSTAPDEDVPPGRSQFEYDLVRADGEHRRLVVERVSLGGGRFFYGIRDVTELEAAPVLAQHDAVTGLPNHALLQDRMRQTVARAHRWSHAAVVLVTGLDRGDQINGAYGHEIGDTVLRLIGDRLKASLRSIDTVARLDGDTFVVVAECSHSSDVGNVVVKILDAVRQPIPPGQWTSALSPPRLTCSIGVSQFPRDGSDPDTLIALARAAMDRASQAGGNRAVDHRSV